MWYVCIRRHEEPDVIGKAFGPHSTKKAALADKAARMRWIEATYFFVTVDKDPAFTEETNLCDRAPEPVPAA